MPTCSPNHRGVEYHLHRYSEFASKTSGKFWRPVGTSKVVVPPIATIEHIVGNPLVSTVQLVSIVGHDKERISENSKTVTKTVEQWRFSTWKGTISTRGATELRAERRFRSGRNCVDGRRRTAADGGGQRRRTQTVADSVEKLFDSVG